MLLFCNIIVDSRIFVDGRGFDNGDVTIATRAATDLVDCTCNR